MNVILLGLPGAGKGTQAKWIIELLGVPHISTGDLFRKARQEQSELGILADSYMSKGMLVPDEETIGLALDRLRSPDCNVGFLLDGFPRNRIQAQALKQHLQEQNERIDHVIYVEVNEELLIERLSGRRVCQNCGKTYHIVNDPPKRHGKCNDCGGNIVQREDDEEATVRERIRINKELTDQLVDFYEHEGVLRKIDGSRDIGQVSEEVLKVLSNEGTR